MFSPNHTLLTVVVQLHQCLNYEGIGGGQGPHITSGLYLTFIDCYSPGVALSKHILPRLESTLRRQALFRPLYR